MIAFGSSITMPDIYERCARPGIARAAEPGAHVLAHAATGPLARTYNLILEEAARIDDLEALVLVHQDAEIREARLAALIRDELRDSAVGVVGAVGVRGAASIAWWDGAVDWGACVVRYGEHGGGATVPPGVPGAPGPTDALYGVVLVLSPWAVRSVRFDEALDGAHGCDIDFCRRIRAAGRTVARAQIAVVHHHALELVHDPELWSDVHARAADRWDGGAGDDDAGHWRARARRAEATAASARMTAATRALQAHAQARVADALMEAVTARATWRLTAPLRRINARRRGRP